MNNQLINTKLLEPDIKAIVLNHLKEKGQLTHDTTVISEFTIDNFSRRVDLALIHNGILIAIEIKSEADSLSRLSGQIEKYKDCFDKVIVISASKHLKEVMTKAPKTVAVWEIDNRKIRIKQRGKVCQINDKTQLMNFMKVNELKRLSNSLKLKIDYNSKINLKSELQNVPLSTLRNAAIQSINERYKNTSSIFLEQILKRDISPLDLNLLSRFKKDREQIKSLKSINNSLWLQWEKKLTDDLHLAEVYNSNKDAFGEVPDDVKLLLT